MRELLKSLWGCPMGVWLKSRLSMHKANQAKACQMEAGKTENWKMSHAAAVRAPGPPGGGGEGGELSLNH